MDFSSTRGKTYVFRLKHTDENDWSAHDVVHGLAQQGDDDITFAKFKEFAQRNKKLFLCKKLNITSEDEFASNDILEGLNDWKPIGSPKLSFMEGPVTWYTVAVAAYNAGVFKDKKAKDELDATKKNNVDETITPNESPRTNHADILEKVRQQARDFSKVKSSLSVDLPQGAMQLAGLSNPVGDTTNPPACSSSSYPDLDKLDTEQILNGGLGL